MSEVKTEPVTATIVQDIDEAKAVPGAIELCLEILGADGLHYICPCGCGHEGWLPFKPAPSPSWGWDGNREKPTLTPSIRHRGHWHGWLKSGVWTSC